jgi:FtsZ-binding cell division protein ZapB
MDSNPKNEIMLFQNEIKKYEKIINDKIQIIGLLKIAIARTKDTNKSMINQNIINKQKKDISGALETIKLLLAEVKDNIAIINSLLEKFNTRYKDNYNKFSSPYKNKITINNELKNLNKNLNEKIKNILGM